MHITILGRQPALGVTELEQLYDADNVRWLEQTALVDSPDFDFGPRRQPKPARSFLRLDCGNWLTASHQIVEYYTAKWRASEHKITLGIQRLRLQNLAARCPKKPACLSEITRRRRWLTPYPDRNRPNTATSHHNKLGLSPTKVELLVDPSTNNRLIIAEGVGAQNITALAAAPSSPARDARRYATAEISTDDDKSIWRGQTRPPLGYFCGTGTILKKRGSKE